MEQDSGNGEPDHHPTGARPRVRPRAPQEDEPREAGDLRRRRSPPATKVWSPSPAPVTFAARRASHSRCAPGAPAPRRFDAQARRAAGTFDAGPDGFDHAVILHRLTAEARTSRRRCVLLVAVGVGSAVAGCGDHVASRGYGPPGDTVPRWDPADAWEVREVLRVGTAGSAGTPSPDAPEIYFGRIDGMDVDSRGRLVVLDALERQVVVVGSAGEVLARFGREGRGPGEFGNAARYLFVGPGDTIYVPDLARRRLHVFGPDGRSVASPRIEGLGVSRGWRISDDGRVVEHLKGGPVHGALVERDRRGQGADTVRTLPPVRPPRPDGRIVQVYASEPAWDLGPGGTVVVGDAWSGEIERGTLDQPVSGGSFRFPFVPDSVSDRDRGAVLALFVESSRRAAEAGHDALGRREIEESVAFAPRMPAFAGVMLGPEGTVWVRRVATPEELLRRAGDNDFRQWEVGGRVWEVFDSAGAYLGRVTMPSGFDAMGFHGDTISGVWQDELGVDHAVLLEIVRGDGRDAPAR